MKKLVSLLLIVLLMVGFSILSVGAALPAKKYGDSNSDGKVDIIDVTKIQMTLAGLDKMSKLDNALADVDADDKISIFDATMIQMKIAGHISSFKHEKDYVFTDVNIQNFSADFSSGKAMVGVPVSFITCVEQREIGNPMKYQYELIDGIECTQVYISELIDSPNFVYTFDNAGLYIVRVTVYNSFGEWASYEMDYQVIAKRENTLLISSVHANKIDLNEYDNLAIVAHAYGGTAPYEYSFSLSDCELQQDYSRNNLFELGELSSGVYYVYVSVKDSSGDIVSTSYQFEVTEGWA